MAWTNSNLPSPLDPNLPKAIFDFAAPVAVSTETPLLALTEYGTSYRHLVFTLRNHDASNRAAFYIDRSESGVVDDEDRQALFVSPLRERTVEFRDVMRLMWALSAAGDPDNAFPSVSVSWRLIGVRRAVGGR